MQAINCTHPDHSPDQTCEDRAVSCSKDCVCCMGSLAETVTIAKSEYESLLEDRKRLRSLEAAGVDNWSGYDYARELYEEDDDDD